MTGLFLMVRLYDFFVRGRSDFFCLKICARVESEVVMSRWFDTYAGYKEKRRFEFESTAEILPALPDPIQSDRPQEFEAERIRPSRSPNIEADVLVPFGWASGLGVLSFGVTLYVALVNGYAWHLSCIVPLLVMALVFAVGILGVQKSLWMVERVFHTDIDRDGYVDPPSPGPVELSVSVRDGSDRARRHLISDLGVTPDQLREFALGVRSGKSLAVSSWTGKGNLFSRSEFDRFMSELERLQMVERDGSGNNAPRVLTDTGLQAISQLLDQS